MSDRAHAPQPLEPAVRRDVEATFGALPPVRASPCRPDEAEREAQAHEARAAAPADARRARRPIDFSHVRIHATGPASAAARWLGVPAIAVGRHIAFGTQEYAPSTERGRRVLTHELAHVVQQSVADASVAQGYGVFGWLGGLLRGDDIPPAELAAYLDEVTKTGRIEDHTDSDNKARAVVRAWKSGDGAFELSARQKILLIREMQSGSTGDDDEQAILELLFRSPAADLQAIFGPGGIDVDALASDIQGKERDRFDGFVESQFEGGVAALRARKVKVIGEPLPRGPDLPAAGAYEEKLVEANQILAGHSFLFLHWGAARFGQLGGGPLPDEARSSSGRMRDIYWYDRRFWEATTTEVNDRERGRQQTFTLRLKAGKSAAEAIDALFEEPEKWKVDCAGFVQLAHLYATRHTLGTAAFDAQYKRGIDLVWRRRESTGVVTKVEFGRSRGTQPMLRSTDDQPDPRSIEQLLDEAPVGSRVRWTNPAAHDADAYHHENTFKVAHDRYAAFPLGTFNRAELETNVVEQVPPDARIPGAEPIFVSQIEFFGGH